MALAAGVASLWGLTGASAQTVKIGMTVSSTGPAASLGMPEANTAQLFPKTIGGLPVEIVVLDDATDPTKGVANTRKLLTDEKADVIVGSSTTPVSLAMLEVTSDAKVPMISLAASLSIVAPMDDKRRWVFKTPQNDSLMADALAAYMADHKIKTVAFIGFSDAYGDGWLTEIKPALASRQMELVATERYARPDTSVTGQALKILASKPDAVLVAGAGTPAVLPQKTLRDRGYKGPIFQTHGVANADFLRVGGKEVDGTVLPAGPVLVAAQLPDANPVKAAALTYITGYEGKYGAGTLSTFGAHANDAFVLLENAIPVAAKVAKPGTPEFRAALRDALEGLKNVVYSQGVVTMTPSDHVGQDKRARVMVTVENGTWKFLPEAGTQ